MLPLFVSDVPLHCINEAAIEYHVPAKLIISILNIEQGRSGQTVKNKNKSYDIGPMQINSLWLPQLTQYGITQTMLENDPCINVKVGTWILSKAIASEKDLLAGVGNYHSHTPLKNAAYSQKTRTKLTKLNFILNQGE